MNKRDADRLYQIVATLTADQTWLLWRWILLDAMRKSTLEAGLTP